eukprot:GHRR01002029.1.p1 GENE.GHRR01002029.1~~GHRR01002029.1.p1  ORF type:complete len:1024 (+),score=391.87 GHRR01002029.1:434-3505(+)
MAKSKIVSFCQVDGCKAKLSNCKQYCVRYRVCQSHLQATQVNLAGQPSRFCQQCGKLHALEEFDGKKRSCRARLLHHNSSRQQRRKEAAQQQFMSIAMLLQQHGPRQAASRHATTSTSTHLDHEDDSMSIGETTTEDDIDDCDVKPPKRPAFNKKVSSSSSAMEGSYGMLSSSSAEAQGSQYTHTPGRASKENQQGTPEGSTSGSICLLQPTVAALQASSQVSAAATAHAAVAAYETSCLARRQGSWAKSHGPADSTEHCDHWQAGLHQESQQQRICLPAVCGGLAACDTGQQQQHPPCVNCHQPSDSVPGWPSSFASSAASCGTYGPAHADLQAYNSCCRGIGAHSTVMDTCGAANSAPGATLHQYEPSVASTEGNNSPMPRVQPTAHCGNKSFHVSLSRSTTPLAVGHLAAADKRWESPGASGASSGSGCVVSQALSTPCSNPRTTYQQATAALMGLLEGNQYGSHMNGLVRRTSSSISGVAQFSGPADYYAGMAATASGGCVHPMGTAGAAGDMRAATVAAAGSSKSAWQQAEFTAHTAGQHVKQHAQQHQQYPWVDQLGFTYGQAAARPHEMAPAQSGAAAIGLQRPDLQFLRHLSLPGANALGSAPLGVYNTPDGSMQRWASAPIGSWAQAVPKAGMAAAEARRQSSAILAAADGAVVCGMPHQSIMSSQMLHGALERSADVYTGNQFALRPQAVGQKVSTLQGYDFHADSDRTGLEAGMQPPVWQHSSHLATAATPAVDGSIGSQVLHDGYHYGQQQQQHNRPAKLQLPRLLPKELVGIAAATALAMPATPTFHSRDTLHAAAQSPVMAAVYAAAEGAVGVQHSHNTGIAGQFVNQFSGQIQSSRHVGIIDRLPSGATVGPNHLQGIAVSTATAAASATATLQCAGVPCEPQQAPAHCKQQPAHNLHCGQLAAQDCILQQHNMAVRVLATDGQCPANAGSTETQPTFPSQLHMIAAVPPAATTAFNEPVLFTDIAGDSFGSLVQELETANSMEELLGPLSTSGSEDGSLLALFADGF